MIENPHRSESAVTWRLSALQIFSLALHHAMDGMRSVRRELSHRYDREPGLWRTDYVYLLARVNSRQATNQVPFF